MSSLTKFIIAWAVVMVLLAVSAKMFWGNEPAPQAAAENNRYGQLAQSDDLLLGEAYEKCLHSMSGFLTAGTPEEKTQFVRNPMELAGRMARYYQTNLIHHIDPGSVRGTSRGVIHLDDGRKLIETRWSIADGRTIDATFFEERGEWRLDWEEYVRYGEMPWSLFVSSSGEGSGEFRLFARERGDGQRSATGDLRIILHEPRFGNPGEVGDPSPEFKVDQLSAEGRLLVDAFAKRSEGGRIYGSSIPNLDPAGMVRVRVKIRRTDGPDGKEFRIEEIKACHWLSIDDPGTKR